MRPGQFGPISRVVPLDCAYAKNAAVSWTGMPSVITTTSGIFASIASITAAFANFGGTKTTEVFAPVAATASLTELKTGSEWPSISTVWPPFPGVTPPTTFVPEANILLVCLVPSEPVIP